jgi:hypothetical protein
MDAEQVSATVLPVDGSRVVVRLDADIHASRAKRVGMGWVLAVMGTLLGGGWGMAAIFANVHPVIVAVTMMLPFAGGIAAAYKVARTHRSVLSSAQLGLEQVLDRLEHGEFDRPGGLLGAIAARPRLPRR